MMTFRKKLIITLTVLIALFCVEVVGTLAWLKDNTDSVVNTFTAGNVDISLTETMKPDGTVVQSGITDWSAQMIPGNTYHKNPVVTVKGSPEAIDCWLFVKIEEVGNAQNYLEYSLKSNGWTPYSSNTSNGTKTTIWYREVSASQSDQSWDLLDGNTVKVRESVTKENMNEATQAQLKFTAYAAQKANRTVDEAWALFSGN